MSFTIFYRPSNLWPRRRSEYFYNLTIKGHEIKEKVLWKAIFKGLI
jgi:hypothetical protein